MITVSVECETSTEARLVAGALELGPKLRSAMQSSIVRAMALVNDKIRDTYDGDEDEVCRALQLDLTDAFSPLDEFFMREWKIDHASMEAV